MIKSNTMNIENMFNLYPANESEIQFKSNIVDVSHFVGYGNAKKGKDDENVLKIASLMFDNGLMCSSVFNAYLKADNENLINSIKQLCKLFSVNVNENIESLNNKKLYKLFSNTVKEVYTTV